MISSAVTTVEREEKEEREDTTEDSHSENVLSSVKVILITMVCTGTTKITHSDMDATQATGITTPMDSSEEETSVVDHSSEVVVDTTTTDTTKDTLSTHPLNVILPPIATEITAVTNHPVKTVTKSASSLPEDTTVAREVKEEKEEREDTTEDSTTMIFKLMILVSGLMITSMVVITVGREEKVEREERVDTTEVVSDTKYVKQSVNLFITPQCLITGRCHHYHHHTTMKMNIIVIIPRFSRI